MSVRNSATLSYTNPPQAVTKSSTMQLRSSQEKPSSSIKKYELKSLADNIGLTAGKELLHYHFIKRLDKNYGRSQTTQYNVLQIQNTQPIYPQQLYSPIQSSRNAPTNSSPILNKGAKKASLLLSLDSADFKDELILSKNAQSQTSKAVKSSYTQNATKKGKKEPEISSKRTSSKVKDEKLKSIPVNYEIVTEKRPTTSKAYSKPKFGFESKESKNVMEEPAKKSSLPNNLTLTLNNIYGNSGSSSYRGPAKSPPSELIKVDEYNKLQAHALTVRGYSKRSDVEEEEYTTNLSNLNPEFLSQYEQQRPAPINNLLIDLARISTDPMKNISKISINNINNINTINNTHPLIEESSHTLSNNPEVINLLKEKNKEIEKLTKDKMELNAALEILLRQLSETKKGKDNSKLKGEQSSNHLQSLYDFLERNTDSKENSEITAKQLQLQLQKRSNSSPISKDMKSVKMMIKQLKLMTDSSKRDIDNALEHKNNLVEALKNEIQGKSKKSAFLSFENADNEEKGNEKLCSIFNLYQRSLSSSGDDVIGKKPKKSPYEPLKGPGMKTRKNNGSLLGQNKQNGNNWSPMSSISSTRKENKTREKEMPKNKALHLEISRTHELNDEIRTNLVRTQPSTTTNAELDLLRRKFSHDPKLVENAIFEVFEGRKAKMQLGDFYEAESAREIKDDDVKIESADIGKALHKLKFRIANILKRHQKSKK